MIGTFCMSPNVAVYLCVGGAAYLFVMSRKLATACACITAVLWLVALRYGNFSRKAQRTYQDALAETNQVCCTMYCLFRLDPDHHHLQSHQASWQFGLHLTLIHYS